MCWTTILEALIRTRRIDSFQTSYPRALFIASLAPSPIETKMWNVPTLDLIYFAPLEQDYNKSSSSERKDSTREILHHLGILIKSSLALPHRYHGIEFEKCPSLSLKQLIGAPQVTRLSLSLSLSVHLIASGLSTKVIKYDDDDFILFFNYEP